MTATNGGRRRLVVAVSAVLVVVALGAGFYAAQTLVLDGGVMGDDNDDEPVAVDESELEALLHEEINDLRTDAGYDELTVDDALASVARAHTAEMAEYEYVGHENVSGVSPQGRVDAADIQCAAASENVAQTWYQRTVVAEYGGESTYETPEELAAGIAKQFEASPEHRENLLDPDWEYTGIGIEVTDEGEVYVTQKFCWDLVVDYDDADLATLVHEELNDMRTDHGNDQLEYDSELEAAAVAHSEEMAEYDYVSHVNRSNATTVDRITALDVPCATVSENVAKTWYQQPVTVDGDRLRYETPEELAAGIAAQFADATDDVEESVLGSEWERNGIGITTTDEGAVYVVQKFCT